MDVSVRYNLGAHAPGEVGHREGAGLEGVHDGGEPGVDGVWRGAVVEWALARPSLVAVLCMLGDDLVGVLQRMLESSRVVIGRVHVAVENQSVDSLWVHGCEGGSDGLDGRRGRGSS